MTGDTPSLLLLPLTPQQSPNATLVQFFFVRASSGIARVLRHLAFIAMLLLACAPRAGASWACEGRICSTTLLQCCCALENATESAHCADSPGQNQNASRYHLTDATVEPTSSCHCTVVLQAGETTTHPSFSFAMSLAIGAVLPAIVAVAAPPTTHERLPLEARGPPLRAALVRSRSLRAPPLS